MEPESKVAPEAISEIRPMSYEQLATMFYATQAELLAARERIASLTAQVATLESERDFAVRSSWRTP